MNVKLSPIQIGVGLAILQQLGFTVETAAIHLFGAAPPTAQLSLLRCLGGVVIALVWAAASGGLATLRTWHMQVQLYRGCSTGGFSLAFMWGFATIPFLDATAISYITTLWIVALAPFIGERWTAQRVLSVVVGFGGALLVIQPSFAGANAAYIIFGVATAMNAGAILLSRYTQDKELHGSKVDSPVCVLFWANTIAAAITVPGALASPWGHFDPGLLVAIMVIGPVAMLVGIIALVYIDASTLAPFNYVRLLLVWVIAPLLFGEAVNLASLVGGSLIIGACWLAAVKLQGVRWKRTKEASRSSGSTTSIR